MISSAKYYTENLYPLQDGVLKHVNELATPFYLTGGTALSRHYFKHRFSDDLDLFVNDDSDYSEWIQRIFQKLASAQQSDGFRIDFAGVLRGEHFTQFYIVNNKDVSLKLDLINDTAPHFGVFEHDDNLGRIDSWRNILSNKLTALGRLEIKDFVDVWMIAKHRSFSWPAIFKEAKSKDAGVDPLLVYELFKTIPTDSLRFIKWIHPIDINPFFDDMECIADDILAGRENSIVLHAAI